MASYNKVLLMSNLTRDPELRYTANGQALAKFGIATNRKFKSGDGMKEEVTYVDCTAWARSAEVICEYMRKGSPIFIEGRLQFSSWEDKESGKKRSKLDVTVERFQFIGGRQDSEGGAPRGNQGQQNRGGQQNREMEPLSDDDIPF
ncbi:single-stranded DNA-binding protein [bacterium]|nr:single-stranded DNA-binding protein [bacterium]